MRRGVSKCFLFIFTINIWACLAHLNFFMSSQEVQKLLGLDMELYYVNDGEVKSSAINYEIPVPQKVENVVFSWESLTGKPLPYSISLDVSNQLALVTPKLNITASGVVPPTLQSFSVSLLCTGVVNEEVRVIVTVQVTYPVSNSTFLKITRKKKCRRIDNLSNNPVVIDTAPHSSNSVNIFYTAIGCAVLLVALLTCCVVVYYFRSKKTRNSDVVNTQGHMTYLTTPPRNATSTLSYGSFRRMPSYSLVDERSKDLHERIAELTIQRCRVRLSSVILEGTFGRVYLGSCTEDSGKEEEVLVKTVTDHASQVQISLLLQEGMFMYSLNHKNILTIVHVSIEDESAPFLLYPYHSYKNLKVFLQKCKLNSEGVAHTLTTQEVVDMALQVLQGMLYLHKKHLVHKDLAARNCVVDDKLRIKVTDNALSRDLFPSDYHCLGDNENRPIKWMAIESLLQKDFSTSSDVWSYGVLLWELTTLAQQPYLEIDPFEMAAYLKDGYRLAQPINCPDELFGVMACCWAMSADERPSFSQLQVCLQDFYAQLTRYV